MKILTHNLGFPRIDPNSELKRALEAYWAGKSDESTLLSAASSIRRQNWQLQKTLGVDLIPSNGFSPQYLAKRFCALFAGPGSRVPDSGAGPWA
jgi:hypothetical protein